MTIPGGTTHVSFHFRSRRVTRCADLPGVAPQSHLELPTPTCTTYGLRPPWRDGRGGVSEPAGTGREASEGRCGCCWAWGSCTWGLAVMETGECPVPDSGSQKWAQGPATPQSPRSLSRTQIPKPRPRSHRFSNNRGLSFEAPDIIT